MAILVDEKKLRILVIKYAEHYAYCLEFGGEGPNINDLIEECKKSP